MRDGLQLIRQVLPTEIKLEWCRQQIETGFKEIEVTSIVPPKLVPQFADSSEILQVIRRFPNLRPTVLVPNLKGGSRALAETPSQINFVISVSEPHNQANVRRTVAESLNEIRELISARNELHESGSVRIECTVATAFGCSIQGDVPEQQVYKLAEELLEAGVDNINIADTVGYGNPRQVTSIMKQIVRMCGTALVGAHFHDTRGMGLANLLAAVDAGIRRFDASLGGLGGCPFAPGATGNIATEDAIYMLENLGLDTGVDMSALITLRKKLSYWLPNEQLFGRLGTAGPAKNFSN